MPAPVTFATRFVYNHTVNAIYKGGVGEGLPQHQHTFAHTTVCIQGRIVVRKEGKQVERTPEDSPLLLPGNEWHEIEALEPNTIFINQYPVGMEE